MKTLLLLVLAAHQPGPGTGYTCADRTTAVRDGIPLFTAIAIPRNATGPLPILMDRTPYGAKNYIPYLSRNAQSFGLDGYILVVQDIRGRFGSEGTFDMN